MRRDRTLGERREPPSAGRPFKVSFYSPLPSPPPPFLLPPSSCPLARSFATRLRCLLNSLNARIAYRVSVLKRDHHHLSYLDRFVAYHINTLRCTRILFPRNHRYYLLIQKENFCRKNRADLGPDDIISAAKLRRRPTRANGFCYKGFRYKSVQRYG